MAIKREAAFHEAGHAIAAYRSKFHALCGPINLMNYGAGEIFISLSKSKLRAAGKSIDNSIQKDGEIVDDLATILSAGLAAEYLAEPKVDGFKADPACAKPDHDLIRSQLSNANLSVCIAQYESTAIKLLDSDWSLVTSLANYLYDNPISSPNGIIAFIERHIFRDGT